MRPPRGSSFARIIMATPNIFSSSAIRRGSSCRSRGYTLVELIVICCLISMLAAITIPWLFQWGLGLQVRMAAQQVAGTIQLARFHAVRYEAHVAVKFRTDDGVVTFALYRDGDGDGVRNRDIDAGIDPELMAPRRLNYLNRRVGFGFPAGEAPVEISNHRRRITRLMDPIRFNRSDLATFDPLGTATPGTVYISDGLYHLVAVRVSPQSAKTGLWSYDQLIERWRRLG